MATYIELQENYLEALEAINDVKAEALEAALELDRITGAPASMVKLATESAAKKD